METETFLPARLFLLAYDPKKQRIAGAWHRPRAAPPGG